VELGLVLPVLEDPVGVELARVVHLLHVGGGGRAHRHPTFAMRFRITHCSAIANNSTKFFEQMLFETKRSFNAASLLQLLAYCRTESFALLGDAQRKEKKIRKITFFHFSFYLSVSIFSAISVSPSQHLPPHLHLITISISLHHPEKPKNIRNGANNLLRFAYSWGHRLKIVVFLAELEIH
jgi:hypothetical protein